MSLADPNTTPWPWMPPDMDDQDKEAFALQSPTDPHRSAANAWEAWGTQMTVATTGTTNVSTGVQSVTYDARGAAAGALDRAKWHRSRMRAKSVEVGPTMEYGYLVDGQVSETP